MGVREDLIAVRALIDTPEKWIKNEVSNDTKTAFCIVGAMVEANVSWTPTKSALLAELPKRFRNDGTVVFFNNHPSTTHADIMALFDRAIEAATPSPDKHEART